MHYFDYNYSFRFLKYAFIIENVCSQHSKISELFICAIPSQITFILPLSSSLNFSNVLKFDKNHQLWKYRFDWCRNLDYFQEEAKTFMSICFILFIVIIFRLIEKLFNITITYHPFPSCSSSIFMLNLSKKFIKPSEFRVNLIVPQK